MVELSLRLKTIADMVSRGSCVADVGCDHGFVSIYLYEQGISPKVYAMDLRSGPLSRAREHIEQRGYTTYIETRLSDGVEALRMGEADALICAGMGGRLMAKILTEGYDKIICMKELILQPQSELAYFRSFLREKGLEIVEEDMVFEDGKYYPIIKAVPDHVKSDSVKDEILTAKTRKREAGIERENVLRSEEFNLQDLEDAYGPLLLRQAHPVLVAYLKQLYTHNQKIIEGLDNSRNEERKQELAAMQEGIAFCLAYCMKRNKSEAEV